MVDSIKITALQDIGANIMYTSLVPVVDMSGTPTTKKSTLQNVGNLILGGAGGSYFPRAAQANLALSVANAAQPNITSVGTLSSLTVSGNITAANINGGNLVVANFFSGDGGFLTNVAGGGSNYGNSNVANYLPAYNGVIQVTEVTSTGDLRLSSGSTGGNWHYTYYANGLFETPSNVNFLGSRLNLGYGSQGVTLTNPTLVATRSGDAFIQAALLNDVETGSSDYAAYGADGDETQGWVDMGFASWGFDDANYTITAPGSGYVFSQGYANGIGGHLVLATGGQGDTPDIVFATGGFLASDEFARIDHANNVFQLTRTGSGIQFEDGTIQYTAASGGSTGNIGFNGNIIYSLSGSFLDNSDLSHGATAAVAIPPNGGGNIQLNNLYGNLVIQLGNSGSITNVWDFDNTGLLKFPDGTEMGTIEGANTFGFYSNNANMQFLLEASSNNWVFDGATSNLTTPSNLVIGANGAGGSSIYQFDAPLQVLGEGANSALIVGWTANSSGPEDVVAMAFNNPLGNGAGNLVIGVGNNSTTVNYWNFDNTGALTLPGSGYIVNPVNSSLDPLNPNVSTMILTPDQGYSSQSLILDPTAPGHIHLRAPGANIDEPSANIFLGGEDSSFEVGYYTGSAPNVFVHSGANTWTFDNTGNLTTPGSILPGTANTFDIGDGSNYFRDAYFSNNVVSESFTTADGGLTHSGAAVGINANAGKDVYLYADNGNVGWTFDSAGNLTLPGNTVAINFANGSGAFGNMVSWVAAPTANTDPGIAGQAAYDAGGNLFVCVATNTWAKFAGTTSW